MEKSFAKYREENEMAKETLCMACDFCAQNSDYSISVICFGHQAIIHICQSCESKFIASEFRRLE